MSKVRNLRLSGSSFKRIVLGGLGGSFGLLGVIIGVGLYIVDTLTRPKREAIFGTYTFSPFELGLPAEEVTFAPTYGEHQVIGWYVPSPGATTTIIMSPGYREGRSDVLGLCSLLWKAGHNVLAFEYYGHGTAVGVPVTLGYREINDFLGAVNYARQRAPQARLGVVGYSMGAAVSIMGTARTPEIEALVADSAFATHKSAIEYAVRRTIHIPFIVFDWVTDAILWWRAGYHFHQVEPIRDIARIAPRPVMIIHGMKDTVVDPRDSDLLYAAAGEPKVLWQLAGVEHCGAYFAGRAAYVDKVIDFFDLYLKQGSPLPLDQHSGAEPAIEAISHQEPLPDAS